MNQHTTSSPDPKINWPGPPALRSLGSREAHVWAATLARSPEQILRCAKTLTRDELDRAGRFHFDHDRRRFIAGRWLLRIILSQYLGKEPVELKFDYSSRGKPALTKHAGEKMLHFNLAHSDDLMLLAVTRVCAVGIDVERLRPLAEAEDIAERFFSARESMQLKTLPKANKLAAFFKLWTRKEAWLKATGAGIAELLNQVQVSFLADEPARIISLFEDAQAGRNWFLHELNPAAGFVAALAGGTPELAVNCWHWSQ